MKTTLQEIGAQVVNVALVIVLVVVWLGLTAYLEAKPSETDAAALTQTISNDRAAEHAALHQTPVLSSTTSE